MAFLAFYSTLGDVEKSLLGAAVVTRYNNKSYRIDDIDWDASPKVEGTIRLPLSSRGP